VRVQRSHLRIRIAASERISQRGPRRACSEFVEAKCQERDDMEFCEDHSETFFGLLQGISIIKPINCIVCKAKF
jgi:hypothetical protein